MAIFAWPEVAILSGIQCTRFGNTIFLGIIDIFAITKLKFSIKKVRVTDFPE